MPISRPDDLGEIANLGLTLAEAKLLLAQVQQQVVCRADRRWCMDQKIKHANKLYR